MPVGPVAPVEPVAPVGPAMPKACQPQCYGNSDTQWHQTSLSLLQKKGEDYAYAVSR